MIGCGEFHPVWEVACLHCNRRRELPQSNRPLAPSCRDPLQDVSQMNRGRADRQ